MRLWDLTAKAEVLTQKNNPWKPIYDKMYAIIVRAENEEAARQLAHINGQDENKNIHVWLSDEYTNCKPIDQDGEPKVIARNIING